MYERVISWVGLIGGDSKHFLVEMGLYHELTLSSIFCFGDGSIHEVYSMRGVSWCMLFVYGIVLRRYMCHS